jgi:hypothetical protein
VAVEAFSFAADGVLNKGRNLVLLGVLTRWSIIKTTTTYFPLAVRTIHNVGHWEIRRKSRPLGVRLTRDGFQMAASFAGKRALADFLSALSKEERRSRR